MRITQDVREDARQKGLDEAKVLEVGLAEKAKQFRDQGGKIYNPG